MFKKIISLMVAVLIVASCAVVAVSAAEVADENVAADSSETAVAADEESATSDASNTIYFQVPDNWNNVTQMYAHVFMAVNDGSKWPAWKTKSEKMTDEGNGLWSYDISKTGNTIDPAKGASYSVVFVNNNDMQTYDLIFGADVLGDTAYVTGNTFENPMDSNKTCIEAEWKSGKYGPQKKILSTGNDVVGSCLPEGSTDASMMADWVKSYYSDATKTVNVDPLLSKLGLTGQQVYDELVNIVNNDSSLEDADKTKTLNASAKLLGVEIKDSKNPAGSASNSSNSNGGSSNGNSSNGGSSNGGSSNSGSGSGTNNAVKSGQDSTILFVLGGVMFAAAVVLFATRKRKD